MTPNLTAPDGPDVVDDKEMQLCNYQSRPKHLPGYTKPNPKSSDPNGAVATPLSSVPAIPSPSFKTSFGNVTVSRYEAQES